MSMDFEIIRVEPDNLYDRVFTYAKGGLRGKAMIGWAPTGQIQGASTNIVILDEITDIKWKPKTQGAAFDVAGYVSGLKDASGSFNGTWNNGLSRKSDWWKTMFGGKDA